MRNRSINSFNDLPGWNWMGFWGMVGSSPWGVEDGAPLQAQILSLPLDFSAEVRH
jgi:hypothetical protein